MSAKRASKRDADSSDEESSEDEEDFTGPAPAADGGVHQGRPGAPSIEQLKREKRLAMNRESARARRRRKKYRLETLEQRAEDLSQRHHNLVLANQGLKARVAQLEGELAASRPGGTGIGVLAGGAGTGAGMVAGGSDSAGRAAFGAATAGLTAEQRASLGMAHFGASASSSSLPSSSFGMGRAGLSDHELQFLQMQQLMAQQEDSLSGVGSSEGAGAGAGASSAARWLAMQDLQAQMARTDQLAALRAGSGAGLGGGQVGGELDRLNMIPDLRRLDELSRIRASEGLRNPSVLDMALSPADAAARRLAQQPFDVSAIGESSSSGIANQPQDPSGRRRDFKSDLYDRLADTNKKFPPRGS
eukprot:Sro199_g084490.2  (360) ;mRNA; r:74681-75838